MSETYKNNPNNETRLTPRGKKLIAGVALTGALAGVAAYGNDKLNDYQENKKQPACDIYVQQDDTVTAIKVRIAEAGDNNPGRVAVVNNNGDRVRPENIQQGHLATAEHVDPAACEEAGGIDPEKY